MARNPWVLPDGFDANTRRAIRALSAALKKSGASIPESAFEQLRLGNIEEFLAFVDWSQIRGGFGDLQLALESAAKRAGTSTFSLGGVDATLLFDLIDERAVQYAQEKVGSLIVEIADGMRETVRDTIAAAQRGELTYQQAAIQLQSTIPLSPRDAGAVVKYREKQFARFMRSGITEAKARTRAENMAARYAAKLLDSRTRTIARTEIMDASMSGRYLGWEAGVSAGYIANDSVKEWIAEPDACPICAALDGTLIGWNDEWQFPEGVSAGSSNRMPPAHPNCRCAVVILPPDFSDNVFTPASGGEMPEEASEFLKHLAGKHDQKTHGRGGGGVDTSTYESLMGSGTDQFADAMSNVTRPDGSPLSLENIEGSRLRYTFRSTPSPEQFEPTFAALDSEAGKFLKDNPISVVVPEEVVDSILDDGRLKSIFETPGFKDDEYLDYRSVYERTAFGYDDNTPIMNRPISGAVLPAQQNTEAFQNFGENYGSTQIVLKDSVKDRATYTIGDSLDTFQRPTALGEKFPRSIDLLNTASSAQRTRANENTNMFSDPKWHTSRYIEAQVHGGISLKDIDKIIFHSPMYVDMEAMTNRLNDMGISWEVTGD
jgi:hypothetical protein